MNIVVRGMLFMAGIIVVLSFRKGIDSLEDLSGSGQVLMASALLPVSVLLFSVSFLRKERVDTVLTICLICLSAFFCLISAGMQEVTGNFAYTLLFWLSMAGGCTVVGMKLLEKLILPTPCGHR